MLRRLVLYDIPGGRCHVSCEVAWNPAAPMTTEHPEVLQPVTTALVQRLERPDAFNPLIAALARAHCSDGRQHVRRAGVERRKKDVPWKH